MMMKSGKKSQSLLWLVEIARGMAAIACVVFILLYKEQAIRVLLFVLGFYLLIDGVLDIQKVVSGKRKIVHKGVESLVTLGTLLLGLTCLFLPNITIFLLLILVTLRFFVRGVEIIREAMQERSKYVGISWLYGLLLIIVGIVPLFISTYILPIIFVFIIIYLSCDGLYLLIRGLRFLFVPNTFTASPAQASERFLDLSEDLPSSTRRALVFVRRGGANGLGHIGWTFEWHNGWFNAGSVEDNAEKPFVQPAEMDFWSTHTLDPIAATKKQVHQYDEYKLFYVKSPRPKKAWKTVIWESRIPYSLLGHNCNDVAYDVLRMYGVVELPDPIEQYVPNDWYDSLPGHSFSISEHPEIPLHLHRHSQQPLAVREISLAIPERVEGMAPAWRVYGRRALAAVALIWEKMFNDIRHLFAQIKNSVLGKRSSKMK